LAEVEAERLLQLVVRLMRQRMHEAQQVLVRHMLEHRFGKEVQHHPNEPFGPDEARLLLSVRD
jgi:hypothetical protein